jgi:hypothetical protein
MASRQVKSNGSISWHNEPLLISRSLAGWNVGLKANAQEQIEVWFARLLLGWIEPSTASFSRADILTQSERSNLL